MDSKNQEKQDAHDQAEQQPVSRVTGIVIQIGSTVATAFLSGLAMSAGAATFSRLAGIQSRRSKLASASDDSNVITFAKNG